MASCDPVALLEQAFRAGIAAATGVDAATVDPQVKASADPKHGDFQCNAGYYARPADINASKAACNTTTTVGLLRYGLGSSCAAVLSTRHRACRHLTGTQQRWPVAQRHSPLCCQSRVVLLTEQSETESAGVRQIERAERV